MKMTIAILCLCVSAATAEPFLITWSSRFQDAPPHAPPRKNYGLLNVADTNAQFGVSYLQVATPALFDIATGQGVAITGTLQDAHADLRRLYRESLTPEVKEARKIWNRGVRALHEAEGKPLGTNRPPQVTTQEFVSRMDGLTNAPTVARLLRMVNAMNAATFLTETKRHTALTEDNDE